MQLVRNGVNDFGYGHVDDIRGNVAQFDRVMQQSKLSRQKRDSEFATALADIDTSGVYSKDQDVINKKYAEYRDWAIKNKPVNGGREENLKFQSELTSRRKGVMSDIEWAKQSRKEASDYYKTFASKMSEEGEVKFKEYLNKPLIDENGQRVSLNFDDLKFKPRNFDLNPFIVNGVKNAMKLNKQIGSDKTEKDGRTKSEFGDVLNYPLLTQSAKLDYRGNNDYRNFINETYESTPELKARFPKAEDAVGAIMLKVAVPSISDEDYIKATNGELTEIVQNSYTKSGGSRYPLPRSSTDSGGAGGITPAQRQNIIDMFVGATLEPTPDNVAQAMQNLGYVYRKPDRNGNKQTNVAFEKGKVIIYGEDSYGDPLDAPLEVIDFNNPDAPGKLSLIFDSNLSAGKRVGNAGWDYKKSAYGDVWNERVGSGKAKPTQGLQGFAGNPFPQVQRPTPAKVAPKTAPKAKTAPKVAPKTAPKAKTALRNEMSDLKN